METNAQWTRNPEPGLNHEQYIIGSSLCFTDKELMMPGNVFSERDFQILNARKFRSMKLDFQ